jgi:hypothetical protein
MRESPSTPISPSTSQQTAANKKATPQGGFFVLEIGPAAVQLRCYRFRR